MVPLKFSLASICLNWTAEKNRFLLDGQNLRWHKLNLCRAAAFQTGWLIFICKYTFE